MADRASSRTRTANVTLRMYSRDGRLSRKARLVGTFPSYFFLLSIFFSSVPSLPFSFFIPVCSACTSSQPWEKWAIPLNSFLRVSRTAFLLNSLAAPLEIPSFALRRIKDETRGCAHSLSERVNLAHIRFNALQLFLFFSLLFVTLELRSFLFSLFLLFFLFLSSFLYRTRVSFVSFTPFFSVSFLPLSLPLAFFLYTR